MLDIEEEAARWHARRFGYPVDIPATYSKLLEEVGELGEALMRQDPSAIQEEAGDVGLVLLHIVRERCADPSLYVAIEDALRKCWGRMAP